jgi:hypothetical protein
MRRADLPAQGQLRFLSVGSSLYRSDISGAALWAAGGGQLMIAANRLSRKFNG